MINAFSQIWSSGVKALNKLDNATPSTPNVKSPTIAPKMPQIGAFMEDKANISFEAIKTATSVKEKQKQAKFYYKGGKYLLKKEESR